MKESNAQVIGLTAAGCANRLRRLQERLLALGLEAALIFDRRHVYYFSGYCAATHHAPLLIVRAGGETHAVLPDTAGDAPVYATTVSLYQSQRRGTLVEDQLAAAVRLIDRELERGVKWGLDAPGMTLLGRPDMRDLSLEILELRRRKEVDEVDLVRHAVRACEAAYAKAAEILRPGIREIDVYAELQAAAVRELGEPIGEVGNDFQSGTPGGPPRKRAIKAGELMPLDVAIAVRGYRCDLCRTFAIGGAPTNAQLEAGRRVRETLEVVEQQAHVGVSCRRLYDTAARMLDGVNGWQFFHHLGHGTGLSPHEAPRLSSDWDDELQVGDLFTMEPGLYHDDLRGGIRLEQNYWLTTDGLSRLSSYPLGW